MQQTEHLKLNLIETGDPMSPAPLNANAQALDALVAGIAAEQHLFKLTEAAVTVDNSPLVLDLSGVDLTRFDALFMFLRRPNYGSTSFISINGTGSACVIYTGSTYKPVDAVSTVLLVPFGDAVVVKADSFCPIVGADNNYATPAVTGGRISVSWTDIQTIALSNSSLPAGSGGVVFGVKF